MLGEAIVNNNPPIKYAGIYGISLLNFLAEDCLLSAGMTSVKINFILLSLDLLPYLLLKFQGC